MPASILDPLDLPWRGDPGDIVAALDSVGELLAALRAPAWWAQAACRGADLALFFPTRGQPTGPALEYCARCPVRVECRDAAIAAGDNRTDVGIFGGMTAKARVVHRSEHHIALERTIHCEVCGTSFTWEVRPGITPMFCSARCRADRANSLRIKAPVQTGDCDICGAPFTWTTRRGSKPRQCGPPCKSTAELRRHVVELDRRRAG